MASVSGISGTSFPSIIGASAAIAQANALLGSNTGLLTFGLGARGSTSTVVDLSGLGQLLSAAAAFQDHLAGLQPGTATSGGGQGFGTDFASLAAETQSFVDAFNGLQSNIANSDSVGALLGGSAPGASALALALDAQAQGEFANGDSALTSLGQLGIGFQPGLLAGGSRLSVDLDKLETAFATDAEGAFALLSQAATTFGAVAGDFVSQGLPQFSTLSVLAQSSAANQFLTNSILSLGQQNGGGLDFAALLALESMTLSNPANGSAQSLQRTILALNEFALVSTLLG